MGVSAYKQTIKATAEPKQIEYRVFQRVTNRLETFKGRKGFSELTEEFKQAIWENQQLWNALSADLIQPDNKLPKDLRAHLLSLGRFIDTHSAKVLHGSATVDAIVEINQSIMKGLKA